jgi:NAD(P)-dependent dehydrogenase (short-subunit alcohol dehydrogenase family)
MNVIITGTSSGIGYGLAKEFLERGNKVWGISRRKKDELDGHENYRHLRLDLTHHKTVRELIPGFIGDQDSFDLVVLNAGILGNIKLMEEIDVDGMKKVMEINVWSNKVLLDVLFGMGLKISQVVGMSSKAALRSTPGWGPYSMSKAALDMLMDIYAKEYPDTHFSSFAPGLVDTGIQEHIYSLGETDKYPTLKRLQEARFTEEMPDAVTAAPMLIEGFRKALRYDSGSHVDVREMG